MPVFANPGEEDEKKITKERKNQECDVLEAER